MSKGKILVVDTDIDYQDWLTLVLQQKGYEVYATSDIVDSVGFVNDGAIDAVILSGGEVFDSLRQLATDLLIPIMEVIAPDEDLKSHMVKTDAYFVDSYYRKPADHEELFARVSVAIVFWKKIHSGSGTYYG